MKPERYKCSKNDMGSLNNQDLQIYESPISAISILY